MSSDRQFSNWQVPQFEASEGRKLGWLTETVQEGQAWFKSQRGYGDMRKALDVISGRMNDIIPEYRSALNTNRLKRNVREVVGTLSDIRPLWGYHSDNEAFSKQAEMMNKVTRAVYIQNFFDRDIREAIQWAAATCTGYIRPMYRRDMAGYGHGDVCLKAYGSPSILPVQLPQDNNLQGAYSVTILDEMPIFQAHAFWPEFQDRITPNSSQFWYSQEGKVPTSGNMFRRIFNKMAKQGGGRSDLYAEIRYTYVLDLAVNLTDRIIPMGQPGTSWYYEVPYMGMEISDGKGGSRTATATDARMYPRRRLMIHTEGVVLYDGPSFDWHGKVPLVPFCVDDWPWEGIGFSLIRDGYNQQTAINELDRGCMDVNRARLDLPMAYDTNSVSKREAQRFDPMEPRARVGFDGSMVDKPFILPVPPEIYLIPPQIPDFRKHLEDTMDYQMGIHDIMALSRARASGSNDDVETMMEANGPIVKDISRTMERSMRDLGEMMKYLIIQYYDASRVMRIVGPDGITPETFDYEPSSLVPSHLSGENPDETSKFTNVERARHFVDNINFFITPNSLHALQQMSRKLLFIQLKKAGVPIDSKTIAEACEVPNFGNIDGNTVIERWKSEQEMQLEFAGRLAEIKNSLPGFETPPGTQDGNPVGRPSSGQVAPSLQQKDGGARSTIVESPK